MSAMLGMGSDAGRFFAPDIITPEQYADRIRASTSDRPEMRLMVAVMENGIATYLHYAVDARTPAKRRARRLFGEAKAWLESDDIDWPYSFANLCTALGYDATHLRRGLRALEDEPPLERATNRISLRRINGSRHVIGAGSERRRPRRSARERRSEGAEPAVTVGRGVSA